MSNLNDLRRAIILNPDEDTPRLLLADYLQENDPDNPLLEFIRLQFELANLLPGVDAQTQVKSLISAGYPTLDSAVLKWENYARLQRREKEMVNLYGQNWLLNRPQSEISVVTYDTLRPSVFRKGFVHRVELPMELILDGEAMRSLILNHPIGLLHPMEQTIWTPNVPETTWEEEDTEEPPRREFNWWEANPVLSAHLQINEYEARGTVPKPIFQFLWDNNPMNRQTLLKHPEHRWVTFDEEDEAWRALERACCLHARAIAGLS